MPRFDNKSVVVLITLLVGFTIGCGSRSKSSSTASSPILNTNADPLPAGALVRLGSTSFMPLSEAYSIAHSPDGLTIATGTIPGSILHVVEFWNAETGRKTGELRVDGHNILGLAWSASGSEIAVSIDKRIEVWDVKTEKLLGKLECKPISGDPRIFWGLRWSRDGRRLTAYLPRGADPAEVHVWDAQTRKILSKWNVHSEILGLDISADGEFVATAGRYFLEVHELATAREVFSSYGFRFRIYSIAFSPDGSTLAGGVEVSNDETGVLLFDAKTGDATDIQPRFPGRNTEVAFSSDGKILAARGWKGSVRLWNVASRSLRAELKQAGFVGHNFSFSPDGKSLVTAERRCLIWDVDTAQPRQVPEIHFRWANSAVFSDDGLLMASGSGDETVRFWRLSDGAHQQATQLGARALALAPTGDKIACLESNGVLSLRDPKSGARIGNLSRPLRGMHAEVGRQGRRAL